MAIWGLTEEMRGSHPWGLDADLLQTEKVITDPVQGDIFVTRLERLIIDTPPFQRLRRVRQLGATHYVYPGATHTRFAHSLGSLHVSQRLMDAVLDQHLGPHPQPRDLFAEWRGDVTGEEYTCRVAEATVLARLGGLLHDLTHVPFGHSIEDDLRLLPAHDKNEARFDHFWGELIRALPAGVQDQMAANQLDRFLRPIVLSKEAQPHVEEGARRRYSDRVQAVGGSRDKAEQYEFVDDIVGNTICADLLDYLRRDHLFAGLPIAMGERYLAYFYVTPTAGHRYHPARMVLRIQRDGRERIDVITELLKHLRYRYELSERALVHHAKLAADAMVGKALVMWRDAAWAARAVERLSPPPNDAGGGSIETLRVALDAQGEQIAGELDAEVSGALEQELRRRGDDGFLEWLRDSSAGSGDTRRAAVHRLTTDLLDRRLFKPVAHLTDVGPGPKPTYERYSDPAARRRLEQAAAAFAEIQHAWRVLVWVPEPRMRLKIAEVLVDTGNRIKTFVDRESRGDRRGADIYDAHRGLWAVSIFVAPEIKDDERSVAALLAYLAAELEVRVPQLGLPQWVDPWDAPDFVAARRVVDRASFSKLRGEERALLRMLSEQRMAGPPGGTISLRVEEVAQAARALLLARDVLSLRKFAPLRGREGDLYGRVLQSAAYGGLSDRRARREAFKVAAEALLSE